MTSQLTPQAAAVAQTAAALMNQRRFPEARRLLAPLARDWPGQADLHFLLGAACAGASEPSAAEAALSDALVIDPEHQRAAVDLARLLSAQGRHAQLLDRTTRAVAVDRPHEALLGEWARALAALGRSDEAVAVRRRAVALNPGKVHPLHNLAATQGDAGLNIDAEDSARAALRLGDRPETWLVLARALQGQNRYDEAENAFAEATARRPAYVAALHDHAQLVWMRTGDVEAATAVLKRMTPPDVEGRPVRLIQARLMQAAGDAEGAYAFLADDIRSEDIAALVLAAQLALAIDPGVALRHAQRATALAPEDPAAERVLIDANLALGLANEALEALADPLRRAPLDQGFIAAQWTAWRLLGDPRADVLYDYPNIISAGMIDAPPGWASLSAYLHDLRTALLRLHGLTAHPLGQSLRHGTQTSANLLRSDDPAICAFPAAIDATVRRYLSFIGSGEDILRSRNTGDYRIQSMWSVRLAPDGFHTNHVHPDGWLSSAFYIETPDDDEAGEHDGWLKFGEPGGPTSPSLAAQRHIRPEPGLLVLFPSYIWHGTTPFRRGARMSIAFDLVPA
ncbi:putative 2OG-Fe(II) oxygenase [Brevundimonas naejangsanensis]|uniref:putative 2OG-Fe(II) oxygenase n=1 Tax=Brevundimonas naejangsanensis TaxID=588932 RepID=UPI0026ECC02E|nr:putative 2OG-Fe(II) oxygenase [Brevundimonas naejangsanensis]